MKKIRKSTGVALAFLIYVSVTAAYLLPRNTEVSLTEKIPGFDGGSEAGIAGRGAWPR